MKVAVYAIALNELSYVERFLESTRDADLVVIADTGSTDGTIDALRAGGAIVHEISIKPWRFDDARNASLALLPNDVDVCIPLDLDEVLAPGWRESLEDEWGDATRGRFTYVWSHLDDGSPGSVFWYDRIHARNGYRWVNPCHEAIAQDRLEERWVNLSLNVHHWPDPTKSRGQYLPLLEVGAAERPTDARSSHYLGREYMFNDLHAQAVTELRRHLALPTAVWRDERAASMRYIGRCLMRLGYLDDALSSFREATVESPSTREPWIELAQGCHDTQHWEECLQAALGALAVTERSGFYLTEQWAWGERADDLASIAAWHLGNAEVAIRHAYAALELAPDDERIKANLAWYLDHPAAGSAQSG